MSESQDEVLSEELADEHAHSDQEHPSHTLDRNVLYYERDGELLTLLCSFLII